MARPETVSDLRRETAEVSLIVAAWGGHVGSGAPLSTTSEQPGLDIHDGVYYTFDLCSSKLFFSSITNPS